MLAARPLETTYRTSRWKAMRACAARMLGSTHPSNGGKLVRHEGPGGKGPTSDGCCLHTVQHCSPTFFYRRASVQ